MGPSALPNSKRAEIDARKLSEYLLDRHHPGNGGKADFFRSLGYGVADVAVLRTALARVAATGRLIGQTRSIHGRKFIIEGLLPPKEQGSPRLVRTIWIVDTSGAAPRFVTAYPQRGRTRGVEGT